MHFIIILSLRWFHYGSSPTSPTSRQYVLANIDLACPAKQIASKERTIKFNTNAKPIGVDNRCSTCISPYVEDFIGPLQDTNKTIKGFTGAQTHNPKTGTLCWQWLDDKGRMHTFKIPNSYYVPECEQRLLSPQHWAQTRSASNRATTHCITLVLNVYLRWTKGDEIYELTLPLNKRGSNVGTLYSHPGYNKYNLFCQAANIKITDDKDLIAIPAHLISDDEDKEENGIKPQIGPLPLSIPKRNNLAKATPLPQPPEDNEFESQGANPCELHLSPELKGFTTSKLPTVIADDDTSVVVDEEDRQESTPEADLLMAHHRFQHISFSKLQEMARQGILPRQLAKYKIPTCSACLMERPRTSLAIQTRKTKATESSSEAHRCYLSRPNGEPSARVNHPNGGLSYKTTLQVCNCVR